MGNCPGSRRLHADLQAAPELGHVGNLSHLPGRVSSFQVVGGDGAGPVGCCDAPRSCSTPPLTRLSASCWRSWSSAAGPTPTSAPSSGFHRM